MTGQLADLCLHLGGSACGTVPEGFLRRFAVADGPAIIGEVIASARVLPPSGRKREQKSAAWFIVRSGRRPYSTAQVADQAGEMVVMSQGGAGGPAHH
jgi:hypothetical protein